MVQGAGARPQPGDTPCPHYTRDQCGGCQLQHLTQGAQLSAKQSIVGEALRRVGGVALEDPGVIPAGRPWEACAPKSPLR